MTESTVVDVLVCTYRRPDLLVRTLDGIARCSGHVASVRIVVVDNDAQQSARAVVAQWAQQHALTVDYLAQPLQNISLTRNVALDNVRAPWIAMIDDDEVPDERWLAAMLAVAVAYDADVVFGPVIAQFEVGAPAWATQGLFQRARFATGTIVPVNETRTANAMVRAASLARDGLRFDPVLGLSGGEDSALFTRMARRGDVMVWCDEACVREWTPPARTTVSWVVKRTFRIGSVDAFNRRRYRRPLQVIGGLAKYTLFAVQGSVLALFWAPFSTHRCIQALRRATMGAGFWYGLVAGPYLEYRSAAVRSQVPP